jgi:hypothetical protein
MISGFHLKPLILSNLPILLRLLRSGRSPLKGRATVSGCLRGSTRRLWQVLALAAEILDIVIQKIGPSEPFNLEWAYASKEPEGKVGDHAGVPLGGGGHQASDLVRAKDKRFSLILFRNYNVY